MAAAVLYHLADDARTQRNPIPPRPSCATRLRINPACVARPEDAAAASDGKRRPCRGEERPCSPDAKRRRRDHARVVSPVTSRKREVVKHQHQHDEESPESKRQRRDDARPVSSYGKVMKRKREGVDGGRIGSCASSRSSFGTSRLAARGDLDPGARREDARRTTKIQERERAQDATRRSRRSGSARSEPRARPADTRPAQAQQREPAAAIARRREVSMDGRPLQEYTESFEEAELRRRETQQKREEARREMDKVVQTVFFNDPYISLLDLSRRR